MKCTFFRALTWPWKEPLESSWALSWGAPKAFGSGRSLWRAPGHCPGVLQRHSLSLQGWGQPSLPLEHPFGDGVVGRGFPQRIQGGKRDFTAAALLGFEACRAFITCLVPTQPVMLLCLPKGLMEVVLKSQHTVKSLPILT